MRRLSPLATALWSCVALVLAGVAAITVGYVMTARTLDVFDQVPAVVSGGIGGIALVLCGCVLAYVQVGRACAERERAQEDKTLNRIGTLAEIERRRIAAATSPKPRTRRTTTRPDAA